MMNTAEFRRPAKRLQNVKKQRAKKQAMEFDKNKRDGNKSLDPRDADLLQ